MKSTLASTADRSIRHLRWVEDTDGWGGDAELALSLLDEDLPGRIEWIETVGESERWNVWVFQQAADLQEEDILIIDAAGLALFVKRIAEMTRLRGGFHHYQMLTEVAEWSITQYDAVLP